MIKTVKTTLSPEQAYNPELFEETILKRGHIQSQNAEVRAIKRSIDARSKRVKINIEAIVAVKEDLPPLIDYRRDYPNVQNADPVVIVGFGSCGNVCFLEVNRAWV